MNKKTIGFCLAGVAALAALWAHASSIVYTGTLVNQSELAQSATYPFDTLAYGVGSVSAQAVYSSATIPSATFTDGQQSTGSFTVVTNTALSTAAATNQIVVMSTTGLTGNGLYMAGYSFYDGRDWTDSSGTTAGVAISIMQALQSVPNLALSTAPWGTIDGTAATVIYATFTVPGAYYNGMALTSSSQTVLAVATATFQGGQDAAIISVNGVRLQASTTWYIGATTAQTATNIASAINANASLNLLMKAGASANIVTTTSTLDGTGTTYLLASSTPAALSAYGNMYGGTQSGPTLGSATIYAPNHGFSTGLSVLYTTGAAAGALGGLANATTYFVYVVDANDLQLMALSTQATAGIGGLVVTSTNSQVAAHTNTLKPLGISGTPGFYWQQSNDGVNWSSVVASSVTMGASGAALVTNPYTTPPTSTMWNFNPVAARYLQVNFSSATTGAVQLKITLSGTN